MFYDSLSTGYGSLISGAFTVKWIDNADGITNFDFSTSCSDPSNSWAALGFTSSRQMVGIEEFFNSLD